MTALLEINDLTVAARPIGFARWLPHRVGRGTHAINGLSFELARGETLGIVGESGSGKSTLARAILRLAPIAAGDIHFDGQSLRTMRGASLDAFRRRAQVIFRDPIASLNPRLTVAETLAEPLQVHRICPPKEIPGRLADLMGLVGLAPELRRLRPAALSAGQCQRLAIARALAVQPQFLLADDALAALEVSTQAQIVNLLAELQRQMELGLIVIGQDLRAVRRLCQRVAVMYLGRIVEMGPTEEILAKPRHPYTQALVAAMPKMRADAPPPVAALAGEPPVAERLPPGCAFHPRCAKVKTVCRSGSPPVRRVDGSVTVWCHLYSEGPAVRR